MSALPAITVVTGGDRDDTVPIVAHAESATIASRLERIAVIMAAVEDVEPTPDGTWNLIVTDGDGPRRHAAAVITPYHTNGPIGAQEPPTASWIVAPAGPEAWRRARSPIIRRTIARGRLAGRVTAERKDGGTGPGDALRIVLPAYGGGPVMVEPIPEIVRECARFAALAADAVAGRGQAPTLDQWRLVVAVAAFGAENAPAARNVARSLVHNAGHPLRAERLVRLTHDFTQQVPRHTTRDLTPPGTPQAMLLSLKNDPFVPTLEPVDTDTDDPRSTDAMAILRAIETMRAATGWTP